MVNDIAKGAQAHPVQVSASQSKSDPPKKVVDLVANQAVQAKAQAAAKEEAKQTPAETIQRAENLAQDLQAYSQNFNRQITFNVNNDSGNVIINIIDADTEETIRQIPSEEMQELQVRISDVIDRMEESAGVNSAESIFFNASA